MLSEVSVRHDGVDLFEPSGSQHGGQEAERLNVLAGFFLPALLTEPPACGTAHSHSSPQLVLSGNLVAARGGL